MTGNDDFSSGTASRAKVPSHGLPTSGPGSRGDRNDDVFGDVDEQLGHSQFGAGKITGGVDVVGLHGPEAGEGADGYGRVIKAIDVMVLGMTVPHVPDVLRIVTAWEPPMLGPRPYKRVRCCGAPEPTAQAARLAVFRWLGFYNHRRRHSTIGYLTPVAFEQRSTTLAIAA